jgi:hypothetical protein
MHLTKTDFWTNTTLSKTKAMLKILRTVQLLTFKETFVMIILKNLGNKNVEN